VDFFFLQKISLYIHIENTNCSLQDNINQKDPVTTEEVEASLAGTNIQRVKAKMSKTN
jgi:hypothetical protein